MSNYYRLVDDKVIKRKTAASWCRTAGANTEIGRSAFYIKLNLAACRADRSYQHMRCAVKSLVKCNRGKAAR